MSALVSLAADIRREHETAQKHAESAVAAARRCGELLIRAKDQCQHGEWLPWLSANCDLSERQAQRYMRVARGWRHLKSDAVSDLTLTAALGALTANNGGQPDLDRELDGLFIAFDVLSDDGRHLSDLFEEAEFLPTHRDKALFVLAMRMSEDFHRGRRSKFIEAIGEAYRDRDRHAAKIFTRVLEALEQSRAP
jgi:Protein of unknown function (DUF3102)